jgi:hypothetical protein
VTAAVDDDRRAALRGAKLAALVAGHWGSGDRRSDALGAAVALAGPGSVGWVLADEVPERTLGPALVWAERERVQELHVVVDGSAAAAAVARQAALFAPPVPQVWTVERASVVPAVAAPAARQPDAPAPPELVDLLTDAGLEIVVEGGLVRGEINGLEVARIVHGCTTAGVPLTDTQLEVGVGKADRELTALVHGELAPVDQLARVVDIVRRHRRPGAPRHPLNQLVPDRWLRAVLCRNPGVVGLASVHPVAGVRPRPNLSERDVAMAAGQAADGTAAVVACSVGIALDLVPSAADARAATDPSAALLLAVPERDDHPGTRRLAARLRSPAEVVPIPADWRAAG